ncbi:MAG: hypothetical protein ACQKBU_04280, partial [Verrucomicrobiales bacterium]
PEVLVPGDRARFPDAEAEYRSLRQRYPDDLGVLQAYLSIRSSSRDEFMDESERELIARLDPNNAMWPELESLWRWDKAEGIDWKEGQYWGKSISSLDEDEVERARESFARAVSRSEYHDYFPDFLRRQMSAFGRESTMSELFMYSGYGQLAAPPHGHSALYRRASQNIESQVRRLESSNDPQEIVNFARQWKQMLALKVHSSTAVILEPSMIAQNAGALAESLRRVGKTELATSFDDLEKDLNSIRRRAWISPTDPLSSSMPLRAQIESEVPLGLEVHEFEPGKKAELAFFDRLSFLFGGGGVLFFVLCCGFEVCRRSAVVKGTARGIMPLFSWKDHGWVAGLGFFFPLLWCVVMTRCTPLAFYYHSFMNEWVVLGWILQTILFLLVMVVALTQVVQWRWVRRGEFLGFRGRADWLGWVAMAALLLAVPAVGFVEKIPGGDEEKGYYMLGLFGVGLVGVLWLMWTAGVSLFTFGGAGLKSNVVARSLFPWSLVLAGAVIVSSWGFLALEKFWYHRDTLFSSWSSESYANAYVERGELQKREALRKVIQRMDED